MTAYLNAGRLDQFEECYRTNKEKLEHRRGSKESIILRKIAAGLSLLLAPLFGLGFFMGKKFLKVEGKEFSDKIEKKLDKK